MLRAAFAATPWAIPGSLLVLATAAWASRGLARTLRASRLYAFGFAASLGTALLFTLSPSLDAGPGRHRFASLEVTLDTFRNLGGINETTLNVALFVPLGLLAALHRTRSVRIPLIAAASAIPLVIEATQYALPSLGRSGFQMNDVIANLLGVTLGLGLGTIARRLAHQQTREPRPQTHMAASSAVTRSSGI
jgi:glycopeptide antibiotics resistance protein